MHIADTYNSSRRGSELKAPEWSDVMGLLCSSLLAYKHSIITKSVVQRQFRVLGAKHCIISSSLSPCLYSFWFLAPLGRLLCDLLNRALRLPSSTGFSFHLFHSHIFPNGEYHATSNQNSRHQMSLHLVDTYNFVKDSRGPKEPPEIDVIALSFKYLLVKKKKWNDAALSVCQSVITLAITKEGGGGGRKKYIYSGIVAQAWKFENPVYFSVHLFSSSFHSLNTYKFNKEFSELKQPEEINAMEFSVKVLLAHTYTRPCLYFFPSLAWSFIQLLIARTGSRPPSFFFIFPLFRSALCKKRLDQCPRYALSTSSFLSLSLH